MARHAAVPEFEKNQRVGYEVLPVVKEHIAEPPTQNDAEKRRASDEIPDIPRWNIAVSAPREVKVNAIRGGKRQHIGEAIPAKPHSLAELNQKRAEIVNIVGKHRYPSSPFRL